MFLQNRHIMTGKGLHKRHQDAYAALAAKLATDRQRPITSRLNSNVYNNCAAVFIEEQARDEWKRFISRYTSYISNKGNGWALFSELHAVLGDPQKRSVGFFKFMRCLVRQKLQMRAGNARAAASRVFGRRAAR